MSSVSVETETDSGATQGELEQEGEESGEEGPDCDSALYQSDIMDFSVTGIAEQLTRMDSVGVNQEKYVPIQT